MDWHEVARGKRVAGLLAMVLLSGGCRKCQSLGFLVARAVTMLPRTRLYRVLA
ncbi:MAG TPA: hypothetical protein VMK12_23615 [Anaeromyxobacteraceae bacterium]|nr:hypothetical protein [Anaeromyxobacteraceae bacterium]